MPLEVEQKFRVEDFSAPTKALRKMGVTEHGALEQIDTYLNDPLRDLVVKGEAFRIRVEGENAIVCYKGPRQTGAVKIREELEVPFSSANLEAMLLLFNRLGFRNLGTVRKKRTTWEWKEKGTGDCPTLISIAFDNVEHLGRFVEIEIVAASGESETAAAQVSAIAKKLGLSEIENRSYLAMLLSG